MATYTTLEKVKEILQARPDLHQGGRNIDFSESYMNLSRGANNVGSISLSRVDFDDTFAGLVEFQVKFTDTTSFSALMKIDPNRTLVDIGTGTRFTSFTADNPYTGNPMFALESAYWSGGAVPNDILQWKSNSTVSNAFADRIITQAEFAIDVRIMASQKAYKTNRQQLLYSAPAPPEIETAATYLGAFFIWQLFNPSETLGDSKALQWWQLAQNQIDDHIKTLPARGPVWITRGPTVSMSTQDKFGNPTFDNMDSFQDVGTTFEDIETRLRDYRKNLNLIGYDSELQAGSG